MRGNGNTMISIGDTVKVSYIGYLADGTVFDSTEMHGGRLLEFEVGSGQMIPGFDLAVSQMEVGESRTASIPGTVNSFAQIQPAVSTTAL